MIHQLTPAIFWDTVISNLSITHHAGFIIQRVCQYGSWNDWLLIKMQFGIEKIQSELLAARHLDLKTLNYFSILFNLPKEKFRCYTFPLSAPEHWSY